MAWANASRPLIQRCYRCAFGLSRRSNTTAAAAATARPSIAPKPVIDIKHIRQNPELYTQNCRDRNYGAQSGHSYRIVQLFEEWQALQKDARGLRERSNILRRRFSNAGSLKDKAEDAELADKDRETLLEEARELKQKLADIETKEAEINLEIEQLAVELPNSTSMETPIGEEPKLVGFINEHPEPVPSTSDRVWRSHVHVGSELGILDFAGAASTSGWGWYFLVNEAALLEQALVQYALSVALKRGWTVVSPPSIVYSHIAAACGFRPRDQNGEQQIYALERSEKDLRKPELCLAGTAEIPLAGMKANQVLDEEELPKKYIGVSRCYRAEAGARGVDTKGLYRVHEFTKVEMFAWTMPDEPTDTDQGMSHSGKIFDEMISIQTEILESLGLHCRILEMPSTDLGASATRKRDIEAYFPSRRAKDEGWGEVTSTSICTDYQSRRLATRVATGKARKMIWPHTVNGTALAVPRVLAALLENGWDEKENKVIIPPVLRPWMGGMETIQRRYPRDDMW
ncbi:seryl-tRNA synthetase [Xylona heveae TC161]|uniref:serine--tRNA ligase n=1 Tax=Xylona heveae (strain CBS 132557 / TC161) TaxID=1328760 RepID=A0A165IR55_XYLHT|nr:seryl-tRNA synthetase [Xylona heveae TC161]KZF25264.1 seryl-tRNA synthetase [Xylona heveae TC161]